jgi:hypothetical protein
VGWPKRGENIAPTFWPNARKLTLNPQIASFRSHSRSPSFWPPPSSYRPISLAQPLLDDLLSQAAPASTTSPTRSHLVAWRPAAPTRSTSPGRQICHSAGAAHSGEQDLPQALPSVARRSAAATTAHVCGGFRVCSTDKVTSLLSLCVRFRLKPLPSAPDKLSLSCGLMLTVGMRI